MYLCNLIFGDLIVFEIIKKNHLPETYLHEWIHEDYYLFFCTPQNLPVIPHIHTCAYVGDVKALMMLMTSMIVNYKFHKRFGIRTWFVYTQSAECYVLIARFFCMTSTLHRANRYSAVA